jgi:nucleotidyltransferase/DNA polymerase involved in DNA repair
VSLHPSVLHPPRPRPLPVWAVLDVDNFAAQAIGALQPSLRDTAFAVIQQRGDHHKSAIFAVSSRAHDLGARPGMPVFVLRRKFSRQVKVIRRDEAAEADRREVLATALRRWTPAIEIRLTRGTLSAVADLAGTPAARLWEPAEMGEQLQRHIQRRCGLRVAVGIAASRLAARLVARDGGAGGLSVCDAADEDDLLRRMATEDLPDLASACRERAALYGLENVDQILQLDRAALVRRFGRDEGLRLYGLVRGLEGSPRVRLVENLEGETVLEEDINDEVGLHQALHLTVDKACHALRTAGQATKAITLRLTYTDNRSRRRTEVLPAATDEYGALCQTADRLFGLLHTRRVALKAFAVSASRTTPTTGQGDLFAGVADARQQRLGKAITDIRQRMGFGAVGSAHDRLPGDG